MNSILVVDDDTTIRETMVEFFQSLGYLARGAATGSEARAAVAAHAPDLAIIDLRLPDTDGLALLAALHDDDPTIGAILLTGHGDVPTAVKAMQRGAIDFLEKPINLGSLADATSRAVDTVRMRRELAHHRARETERSVPPPPVPDLDRLVSLAARNDDAPVLISGETGTGKGYVARRIHDASPRRSAPFVEINCASLSATFFESELFGHERGAFTDARQAKRGLLEVAGGGTAFLDEIAEMSPEVQAKLLKVIEQHTYRRLGGTVELRSLARVVVATNIALHEAVTQRRFRADLMYRLQVLTIHLPPLRERRDAIPALAELLLPRSARLGAAAHRVLLGYSWPGNIRELKNTLWRASILAEGEEISPLHLGLAPAIGSDSADDFTLAAAERRAIRRALDLTAGNKTQAAERLGIARSTLNEKLKLID